jgi:lon-related putative ATP-dependent protease
MSTPVRTLALEPAELRHHLSPDTLDFQTTADIEPSKGTIGQPRATSAISFGLEVRNHGYNLFATGRPGSAREGTITDAVSRYAPTLPGPDDWIYVFNFADADRPNAIRLPQGMGAQFASDMEESIETVRREIVRAFETEEYDRQRHTLLEDVGKERSTLVERLNEFAKKNGFLLEMTPSGIITVPAIDGKPVQPNQYAAMSDEERAEIERRGREVQKEIANTMRQVRLLDKDAANKATKLDRDVAQYAVDPVFSDLKEKYQAEQDVVSYIDQVLNDIVSHYQNFLITAMQEQQQANPYLEQMAVNAMSRYEVNVFVDNSGTDGAPVVVERHPTYYNLIGRINYRMTPGAMTTDFRQIMAGALHRANGGFLILHATEILSQPFAWDALKRSLLCTEIRIDNLGAQFSAVPAATLRPEPIPLDVKVIIIGSHQIYQLLYALDESFEELFKVKADFAPDMQWNDEYVGEYLAFISRYVRDNELRHLDRAAAARVVEYGARLQNHKDKLSTRMLDIANILTEASHWAGKNGRDIVQADDVDMAINLKEYRSNLMEERYQELIDEGTIDIETDGERVGQLNGISIIDLGDYTFGRPSRVSARVSLGRGKIESIERAIKLSGPIHSKGFMILNGYLSGQYAQEIPLAVNATITFEQSYSEVDGDSASSVELYALLSVLSNTSIKQSIAVTGAVDQNGYVRAVGGVTRKIEGFYAVCKARGLDGSHGVIIPSANVRHLMLSDEVIEAVQRNEFTIWSVATVNEGIEILTGHTAGERGPDGRYPDDTIHGRVESSLRRYAETARTFTASNVNVDGRPMDASEDLRT